MIAIPFAAGSALVVLGWLVFRAVIYIRTGQFHWKREAVQLLFLVNLLVIHRMTFHPFEKLDGQVQPLIFDIGTAWPFRINFIPFVNLLDYDSKRDLLLNLIGNMALFIPLGIVWPVVFQKLDTHRKVVAAGVGVSLSIEILQLPFFGRATDVDDLILNSLGFLMGYGIYLLVKAARNRRK